MKTKKVSVAEGKQSLSRLLREAEEMDTAILIYRRDRLAGALLASDAFERLMRLQAHGEALELSKQLAGSGLNAADLAGEARRELA